MSSIVLFAGHETVLQHWTSDDATSVVPWARWDSDATDPGERMARPRFGAFLPTERVVGFDCAALGISPGETRTVDPQQRLLLEVGCEVTLWVTSHTPSTMFCLTDTWSMHPPTQTRHAWRGGETKGTHPAGGSGSPLRQHPCCYWLRDRRIHWHWVGRLWCTVSSARRIRR